MHQRKSIRLIEYDYSQPGEYFVTICTYNHECILGEIINGEMCLNEIWKIVNEEWLQTAIIRPDIQLDSYVIMPNHIHGIIVIKDESPILPVGTHNCAFLQRKPRSLGSIIAGFKSAATKRIHEIRDTPSLPIWQGRYFDHVIRCDKELNNIRDYIHSVRMIRSIASNLQLFNHISHGVNNNVLQWAINSSREILNDFMNV